MNNEKLLKDFYTCFKNRDAAGMARCYHPQIEFSDPVFPNLKGNEVGAMWSMLIARGKETQITFGEIIANETEGSCKWEAIYPYGPKRRRVHNVVTSHFRFQDGKIIKQTDRFDLWKWLSMALGPSGTLLGWSGLLKNKVRALAARSLKDYLGSNS
jgi:hypothetical protein